MTPPRDRILVVDDEEIVLSFLTEVLSREGFEVVTAQSARSALERLSQNEFELVLSDIRMPGMDGLEMLKAIRERHEGTDVILMTGYGSVDGAIHAMSAGAADYLIKPLKPLEIVARVKSCRDRRRLEERVQSLQGELQSRFDRERLISESHAMASLVARLPEQANGDQHLVIFGESGSGRHCIARSLHRASPRREERLAELDCNRLDPARAMDLIFGHTSASTRRHIGQVERIGSGTLHLAEFDHLQDDALVRIAHMLRDGTYSSCDESRARPLSARILLSTSAPLQEVLAQRNLGDNAASLALLPHVHVPPLRERREDVPGLIGVFTSEFALDHGRMLEVTAESVALLQGMHFPGNVRQLFVTLGHAASLCPDGVLTPEWITRSMDRSESSAAPAGRIAAHLDEREYQLVLRAVQRYPRRLDEAARELGVSRTTLWRRMRKYDIRVPPARPDPVGDP